MEGDDEHDPDETAAIDAEHAALRAAQAAEPDHLDRSPAEIAAQAAQDAQCASTRLGSGRCAISTTQPERTA